MVLDIHSGMRALLRPFGHQTHLERDYGLYLYEMDKLLEEIKDHFCLECAIGNAF